MSQKLIPNVFKDCYFIRQVDLLYQHLCVSAPYHRPP
jgi:hypothetical protein